MASLADQRVPEPDLEVIVEDEGTTRTITPAGEIDLASCDLLQRALDEALGQDRHETVVLDLGDVTFIDSTGITTLVTAHARAKRDGRQLVLRPGPPQVQRTLEICGVHATLPFAGNEDGGSDGPL